MFTLRPQREAPKYNSTQAWISSLYRRAAFILACNLIPMSVATLIVPQAVWGSDIWEPITDRSNPRWAAVWFAGIAIMLIVGLCRRSRRTIDVAMAAMIVTWAGWAVALTGGIIADGWEAVTAVLTFTLLSSLFAFVISPLTAGPPRHPVDDQVPRE